MFAALFCVALSACVSGASDEMTDDMNRYQPRIVGDNRLALNRLALNRMALNRMALNRLALNRLSGNRLQLNGSDDLVQSEEGRELLRYVAQCALPEGTTLEASYQGTNYQFPGLLGLAPTWETAALTVSSQRMMSACLLAHVNAFDVSVPISLRASQVLPTTPQERQEYSVYEGTFFGQVFEGDQIKTYSCQGSAATAALAHSQDRAQRVCTDNSGQCAIESVGRCRDVCEQRREDEGWVNCQAHGVLYPETISVYLFADNPDGMNQQCTSDGCRLDNPTGSAAMLDCAGMDSCNTDCSSNSTCSIDGTMTNTFQASVGAARFSEIDCYGNNDCDVTCREGASCDVDCMDTNDCQVTCSRDAACEIRCGGPNGNNCDDIRCRGGAACILHCGGVDNCEFSECHAGALTCPGDIIVCGRPCP
ncbi:MAG TPA: hypothetical protein VNM90_20825 [Haliangium sp.]|nr:hypothetical protein [Haliangium sp.]